MNIFKHILIGIFFVDIFLMVATFFISLTLLARSKNNKVYLNFGLAGGIFNFVADFTGTYFYGQFIVWLYPVLMADVFLWMTSRLRWG
ncbi:MAG: hypothetical protein PHW95_03725 [Patescibacteria group bacterium]|nr:hypothetical protein [Patescibacteria group bacterium]